MDGEGCGERIAFLEQSKVKPRHGRPSASAIQPLPPPGAHFVADPRDGHRVPGDPIVAVVAAEFPREHRVPKKPLLASWFCSTRLPLALNRHTGPCWMTSRRNAPDDVTARPSLRR